MYSLQAVDMNGDGYLDLVGGVLKNDHGIFYWKGNGTDSVEYVKAFGEGYKMGQGSMADLDKDGDFDLIYTANEKYVSDFNTGYMINTGSRTSPMINKGNNHNLIDIDGNRLLTNNAISAVDFDGDNDIELLFTRRTLLYIDSEYNAFCEMSMEIHENRGDNTFYPFDTIMTLDTVSWREMYCPSFGDLNGDGILDMVYLFKNNPAVYVKWGSYKQTENVIAIVQKKSSFSIANNVLKFADKQNGLYKNVYVYNTGGKLFKKVRVSGDSFNLQSLSLSKGVYILNYYTGNKISQSIKWQNSN